MPAKSVAAWIEARIHVIREERVMLDSDLAALYGVQTGILNRAVARNRLRFPVDFMFRLSGAETDCLRFQIGIAKVGRGGRRYPPHAFTAHGVAMLSSVLRSERAIAVNILIMRTFVQMRRALNETTERGHRVERIERRIDDHGEILEGVPQALRALERPAPQKRREIGFRPKT